MHQHRTRTLIVKNSHLQDSNWRKRNAAVNLLLIVVVSQKGVDHTASLLKPYIPWIQTLTRDKESFKISIKAHRVLKAVFDRFPSLVPEETELKNLVTTIHLYMAESLDIVNKRHEKKLDHLTSSADYVWADTLDSLIGASFKNASKVFLIYFCFLFINAIYFLKCYFKRNWKRKDQKRLLYRLSTRRLPNSCVLLQKIVSFLPSNLYVCCWLPLQKTAIP